MATPASVAVCDRALSAATTLSAFMLVLGNVTVANQAAKSDNSSPALRWRVAASPGGRLRWTFSTGKGRWGDNPVHALAVARDGVLYAGVGTSVEAILVVSSQK